MGNDGRVVDRYVPSKRFAGVVRHYGDLVSAIDDKLRKNYLSIAGGCRWDDPHKYHRCRNGVIEIAGDKINLVVEERYGADEIVGANVEVSYDVCVRDWLVGEFGKILNSSGLKIKRR